MSTTTAPVVVDIAHFCRSTACATPARSANRSPRWPPSAYDGDPVRSIPCAREDGVGVADDMVDALMDEAWEASDIALFTTQSRHPKQINREQGKTACWDSFWDVDQVFYGHRARLVQREHRGPRTSNVGFLTPPWLRSSCWAADRRYLDSNSNAHSSPELLSSWSKRSAEPVIEPDFGGPR